MARVTKSYDERKNEIIKMSQKLFLKKGYENTSINDIVNSLGVAKGLCYHYFKSKEQLFEASMKDYINEFTNDIIFILNNTKQSIEDRLFYIFKIIVDMICDFRNINKMGSLDKYNTLHNNLVFQVTTNLIDPVSKIIEENLDINLTKIDDTKKIATFLLFGLTGTIESMINIKDYANVKLDFIGVVKLARSILYFDEECVLERFNEVDFHGK